MPRSSTIWAAALFMASMSGSGPLLTTAEAMPAPGPGQAQDRPRYYFPRHVKRDDINAIVSAPSSSSSSEQSTSDRLSSRQIDFPS
ncbi:hypothetical protein COCVIDRAFT_70975, partial [Bipolaris victoriae FI3]